jgi:predicted nucleotidyltransferase
MNEGSPLRDFDPGAVAEIRQRLSLVKAQGVRIGFAIESGSRAWGFPSPDSDYDCRFVYMRPVADHLKLLPERDVIEFPVAGLIDTGGWDLRKALLLALKGNAVIVEWLRSPFVYEEQEGFRRRLSDLLEEIMDPVRVARHYRGLFLEHYQDQSLEPVKLKRLLYALRPVMALLWLEKHDYARLPPMNMTEVMADLVLPDDVVGAVRGLIDRKKVTRELGTGLPPAEIAAFLKQMYDRMPRLRSDLPRREVEPGSRAAAEKFYRSEIERFS